MAFDPYKDYRTFKSCLGCLRPIDTTPSISDPAGIGGPDFCSECRRIHEMQMGLRKEKVRPPLPRETRTEPLIGLRVWKLARENQRLFLQSASFDHVWPHRKALQIDLCKNEGIHCIKRDLDKNKEPDRDRWWATNLLAEADDTVEKLFQTYNADVAGEVYLWGKVVEHEIGYLAEFAYPKRLFVPEDTDVLTIMQIEENYGVPVETDARFQKPKPASTDVSLSARMVRQAVAQLSGGNVLPKSSGINRQIFQYGP